MSRFYGSLCTCIVNFAMLSPVRLSVVCLTSVTLVRPTQAAEIFGNISTAFVTLTIR